MFWQKKHNDWIEGFKAGFRSGFDQAFTLAYDQVKKAYELNVEHIQEKTIREMLARPDSFIQKKA